MASGKLAAVVLVAMVVFVCASSAEMAAAVSVNQGCYAECHAKCMAIQGSQEPMCNGQCTRACDTVND